MSRATKPDALVEALKAVLTSNRDRGPDGTPLNFADALLLGARVIAHGLGKVSLADNSAALAAAMRDLSRSISRLADALAATIVRHEQP
jgi:hypothetical protein